MVMCIIQDCLEAYAACKSSDEVLVAQAKYLEDCRKEQEERMNRFQLPRYESSDESEQEAENHNVTETVAQSADITDTDDTLPPIKETLQRAMPAVHTTQNLRNMARSAKLDLKPDAVECPYSDMETAPPPGVHFTEEMYAQWTAAMNCSELSCKES